MAKISKNPTQTKPQGAMKMPVPIGANDERRWRSRDTLAQPSSGLATAKPGRPRKDASLTISAPKTVSQRKNRIAKTEKLDPLV